MFLRIQATNTALSQLQYQPNETTNPGYGFAFIFNNAVLADSNGTQLFAGEVGVRVNPTAIEPIHLTLLGRLLEPFNGNFAFQVEGTYTVSSGFAEVLAESILGINIQPT